MSSVTFDTVVGGDGSTVTDDDNATTGLGNGGHLIRTVPMMQQVVNVASYVITIANNTVNAPATNATSTTSLTIGTGSKSLTLTQTGKLFYIGQTVSISDTTGLNVMSGTITVFDSGTGAMTVNVMNAIGTGTIASWIISVGALSATSTGTSIVKGNGTGGFSAAVARTDYAEPTTGLATGILKNTTTTGAHTIAVAGTDYQAPLVSATNIKTINGVTILGSGDLTVTASGINSGGSTNMTGLIKGNGSTVSVATAGTDYAGLSNLNAFTVDQTVRNITIGRGGNQIDSYSTAFGYQALFSQTGSNVYNTAIGYGALYANVSAQACTAVGLYALQNSTASNNTAVGYSALQNTTTGDSNTAIGLSALVSTNYSNTTGLGAGSAVTASNQVQAGNSSTGFWCYGAVNNRSDIRDKTDIRGTILGLDFINRLRPVDYIWDYREDYRPKMPEYIVPADDATDEEKAVIELANKQAREEWCEASKLKNLKHDGTHKRKRYHHGLIAQDVQALIKETGIDFGGFKDVSFDGEGDDVLGIGYEELIAPLIKAIQQLSADFEAYKLAHP